MQVPQSDDEVVRGTNDDATISKHHAVKLGYFEDPFVAAFVSGKPPKRIPLIHRGYFARVHTIRKLITDFVEAGGDTVVSFGAGFDTSFLYFSSLGVKFAKYIELDFGDVILKKGGIYRKNAKAWKGYFGVDESANLPMNQMGEVTSDNYVSKGVDLRDHQTVIAFLEQHLQGKEQVLVLSECVWIYLQPEVSQVYIQWFSRFPKAHCCIYEQIHPHDPFGKSMVANLVARGCPLLSLAKYPDLEAQHTRFEDQGYQKVQALSMNQVYDGIDKAVTARIEKIETLDELEEWNLFLEHYCMVLASTDPHTSLSM